MSNLDRKPVPPAPNENLWSFTYKDGPAPKTAHVRGRSEDEAYRVAVHWCEVQGFRAPAKVFPFIVAGPEILVQEAPVKQSA